MLTAALLLAAVAAPLPSTPDVLPWPERLEQVTVRARAATCDQALVEAVRKMGQRMASRGLTLGVWVDPETAARVDAVECDGRRVVLSALGVSAGGGPEVAAERLCEVRGQLGRSSVSFDAGRDGFWLVQRTVDTNTGLTAGQTALLALVGDLDWLRAMPELSGLGVDVEGDSHRTRFRFPRADLEAFDRGELDADTLVERGRRGPR